MYYVMSDIHGEYEKYLLMLDLIKFSEKDSLFILGDMVDRGLKPVSVLKDVMIRPNVFPIMGNHEVLAIYLLEKFCAGMESMNFNTMSTEEINEILAWLGDGGETTIAQFQQLDLEQRRDIISFMAEFPLYETLDLNDKTFILVHAGLGNFREDKKLSEYTMEELLLTRDDPNKVYFKDKSIYLITGHTPTPLISGKPEIYHSGNHLQIDCGACFEGGRLACVCLDTLQEFYVSGDETMQYFSIMGDSISSFVGTVPKGYRVHYDYENMQKNGMRYISEMWWARVISHFQGRICVNNSYAGSCVAGKHPFSGNSLKRTQLLHNGNIAPDIVLIYMGIKDFGRGVPVKGRNFLWKNPIYFEDAYSLMIKRIQSYYHPVKIVCGTVARTYHTKIPNWQFPEKFSGIPLEAYNEAIRFVAQKQECYLADLSANKIYYETMDGTHPTVTGHAELAEAWINCLSGIL